MKKLSCMSPGSHCRGPLSVAAGAVIAGVVGVVLAIVLLAFPAASFAQAKDSRTPELLDKACTRGEAAACFALGMSIMDSDTTTEAEAVRGVKLWQKACDGGNADGCFYLGSMYEDGNRLVGKDDSRAISMYEKSCNKGMADGCKSFDRVLASQADDAAIVIFKAGAKTGESAAALGARAYAPLLAACDRGSPRSCQTLGAVYRSGDGVVVDEVRGAAFYKKYTALAEKHCNIGVDDTCAELGHTYRLGIDVAKNEELAVAAFAKACALGYKSLCVAEKKPK